LSNVHFNKNQKLSQIDWPTLNQSTPQSQPDQRKSMQETLRDTRSAQAMASQTPLTLYIIYTGQPPVVRNRHLTELLCKGPRLQDRFF
jgi:hypothetical protein